MKALHKLAKRAVEHGAVLTPAECDEIEDALRAARAVMLLIAAKDERVYELDTLSSMAQAWLRVYPESPEHGVMDCSIDRDGAAIDCWCGWSVTWSNNAEALNQLVKHCLNPEENP